MNLKSTALGVVMALAALPTVAAEQTANLSVPGMNCPSCPFVVQAAISDVDGVQSVETRLETRTALVVFDDEVTTIEDITSATLQVGYESSLIEGDT